MYKTNDFSLVFFNYYPNDFFLRIYLSIMLMTWIEKKNFKIHQIDPIGNGKYSNETFTNSIEYKYIQIHRLKTLLNCLLYLNVSSLLSSKINVFFTIHNHNDDNVRVRVCISVSVNQQFFFFGHHQDQEPKQNKME